MQKISYVIPCYRSQHTVGGVVEVKLKEAIVKEVGIAWRRDATSPLLNATVRFAKGWAR